MTDIDSEALRLFSSSCAALGAEVFGRRQVANIAVARNGFARLSAELPDHCDAWRGLIAAGVDSQDHRRTILENAYRTIDTYGELMELSDVASDGLDFNFNTGLYVNLRATGVDGLRMAVAAARADDKDFQAARDLIDDRLLAAYPLHAGWILAAVHWRALRWTDVRRILGPLTTLPHSDQRLRQAVEVAYWTAAAHLGMWDDAQAHLEAQGDGPLEFAAADALLTAGLCARQRSLIDTDSRDEHLRDANRLLNAAYAVPGIDAAMKSQITNAISDPDFGIFTTTAARIDARTEYWNPDTEPGEREHSRALGAERRAELKAEALAELDEFVGMVEVKAELMRLGSTARAAQRREERGLKVRRKSLHTGLKGPPGVGKSTIARVIGKLLCAAEVLPGEAFVEVTRADLVDDKIGGTERKVREVLARVLDPTTGGGGVLFIDEAYALTNTGSKNDFGPKAIEELLTAMVDYQDRLMVIVAGYVAEMDEFYGSNPGLFSRIGREFVLPSYSIDEMVEIAQRAAAKADSVIADITPLRDVFTALSHAYAYDNNHVVRPALDVAGNGRFAHNLIGFAEEEREYRLDMSGRLDEATDEELQTILPEDIHGAIRRQLSRIELVAEADSDAQEVP